MDVSSPLVSHSCLKSVCANIDRLQEEHVSRRIMYFVNEQVYFRCRQRMWCEELWTDHDPQYHSKSRWNVDRISQLQRSVEMQESHFMPHDYLFATIQEFRKRGLSKQIDAINALAGVLQRVAHVAGTTALEGVLVDILPVALLFVWPRKGTGWMVRNMNFPSWSWAGWSGKSIPCWEEFECSHSGRRTELLRWTLDKTYSMWWLQPHEGQRKMLWTPESSQLDTVFRGLSPSLKETFEEALPHLKSSRAGPLMILTAVAIAVDMSDRQHVFRWYTGWCQTVELWDYDNVTYGHIYQDTYTETQDDLRLLVLSRCSEGVGFPVRGNDKAEEEVLWVMAVTRCDDGVHERRGIGQVLKSYVDKSIEAGATWETVLLG